MSAPVTQFAYRSAKELAVLDGMPQFKPAEGFSKVSGNTRGFLYSKNGAYFAYSTAESVKVFDASTNERVSEIVRTNVIEIGFSPRGTFLSTWERPTKLEDGSGSKNLTVWDARSGNELASFTQKGQSNWNLQWTENEEYCARMVTGEVHFWESKNVGKAPWSKLRLEGISAFSLSPGKNPSVAVFIPEIKGAPAIVRMFGILNFNTPLSNKTFYKADKVEMIWHNSGGNLLVVTHTDVDKTGKSYYGETNLYHMSVTGNIDRVALEKEGPIHDVTWSPISKEFVVVYGSMPAQATLFDHRINAVKDFGLNPRNFVRFNPQGRILCIAGFGNLNGTVDLWDLKTQKKITTLQASNASYCDWSPDGRYLMTATLTPRLRVDNGYKVWHYQGTLVYWEGVDELYQINWRPAHVDLYPMRNALSPAPTPIRILETTTQEAKPAAKPAGAYRPPGLRGTATPSIFKREDENPRAQDGPKSQHTIPGTSILVEGPQVLSKTAIKNKKKREAKKKAKEDGEDEEEPSSPNATHARSPAAPSSPLVPAAALPSSVLNESDKKVRNIEKKLRQITDLKEKQSNGEKLELTQIQKIQGEAVLLKELEQLKLQ